jgi:hypothetical protein
LPPPTPTACPTGSGKRKEKFWAGGILVKNILTPRKELKTLCRKIGIASYSFMGTPFKTSLNFIFPFVRWKESLSKRLFPDTWLDINKIRVAPKTFLDPYLGWMLILAAKKEKIVPGI